MIRRLAMIAAVGLIPALAMADPLYWCGHEWTTYTISDDPSASCRAYLSSDDFCFAADATTFTEIRAYTSTGDLADIDVSVSVIKDSGDPRWGRGFVWGLRVNDSTWPDYYILSIAQYSFWIAKKVDYRYTTIMQWTTSPAINSDLGAANRLRVRRIGYDHNVWINDVLVHQFSDGELGSGHLGLLANDTQPFLVRFGDFDLNRTAPARNWQLYR